jgi:hypothetical protein
MTTDYELGQMHDRWLADARSGTTDVWCENPQCRNHTESVEVGWESEYGQGWYVPEQCPICHSEWTEEEPEEIDEDDV